jgi:hypothetical protein
MATNSQDWVVADGAFKRIGDNWSKTTWSTEAWFKEKRDSAAQVLRRVSQIRLPDTAPRDRAAATTRRPTSQDARQPVENLRELHRFTQCR